MVINVTLEHFNGHGFECSFDPPMTEWKLHGVSYKWTEARVVECLNSFTGRPMLIEEPGPNEHVPASVLTVGRVARELVRVLNNLVARECIIADGFRSAHVRAWP